MPSQADMDAELEAVKTEFLKLDPKGIRTAQVLRNTLDQLYDGQRTGRYRWDQLHKTEKTHCGTLVEINLHREFEFHDGAEMDYKIAGIEVDCKYSQSLNAWMIPPEAHGHLCLVIWADDNISKWSMGIVRIKSDCLNTGGNRDKKATLNESGRKAINWLFREASLPPNVLLHLDRPTVERILAIKSGTKATTELFRIAQGNIIGRAAVATVAQQVDYMKRVRANGGARSSLRPEGILILGQFNSHAAIARALGIPIPMPGYGESISVRVAAATGAGKGIAKIGGGYWRVANKTDLIVCAPKLPEI